MSNDLQETGFEDGRVKVLRDSVRRSFPVSTYEGKITNCDGAWLPELTEENAIHDDDMFVYEALKGRTWPEIPREFLMHQPDGFVLLTDDALVAYLGAWLIRALDDMDGENIVREFVTYSFSPSHDQLPDMTPDKIRKLRLLNSEQQVTLRSVLAEFAEREHSAFIREHAARAVELIDRSVLDTSARGSTD